MMRGDPRWPLIWPKLALSNVGLPKVKFAWLFDEALAQLRHAQRLDPLSLVFQIHVGWIYFYSRHYDRAIEQYQKVLEMDPSYNWARVHLSQAYEQKRNQYVSPYSIAMVYAGLEEKEQALAWLRKGVEQRARRMVRLQFDHRFKNLRPVPQFIEVLRRVNPAPQATAAPALADLR